MDRLDPGPLIDASGGELRGLARRLGIDPAVLCRPLTPWQADRYAHAIGKHPLDVWGDDWWTDPWPEPTVDTAEADTPALGSAQWLLAHLERHGLTDDAALVRWLVGEVE